MKATIRSTRILAQVTKCVTCEHLHCIGQQCLVRGTSRVDRAQVERLSNVNLRSRRTLPSKWTSRSCRAKKHPFCLINSVSIGAWSKSTKKDCRATHCSTCGRPQPLPGSIDKNWWFLFFWSTFQLPICLYAWFYEKKIVHVLYECVHRYR